MLMIALLVTPASSARQWTGSLGAMVCLAATFGALCGGVGSVISFNWPNMPTGPVIVLVATMVFLVSLVFAPRRGLVYRHAKRKQMAKEARLEHQVDSVGGAN